MVTILFLIFLDSSVAQAQGVIPTKGTDFWLAVPFHPVAYVTRCDVFVTSDVNTSGTISVPAQGWSQPFSVVANVTTTISLPLAIVENIGSDNIELRGVQILTIDTVNVFAIVIQNYSADAAVIYPKSSLGTEYMVSSYRGITWGSSILYRSQLQIAATEDGTQVQIIPSVTTDGGHIAGVPYLVNLNKGQTYQVKALSPAADLSGTTIKGTDSSGSCRPFAVFSGTSCAYVPSACTACDILYDQALPVQSWGKTYYVVPFGTSNYTLRVMAYQNGTTFLLNGVSTNLNAGQYVEYNNINTTRCIQSNKPICATQYMQGINCGGSGDPAMMYLNAEEQKIDQVTFSTVTSTIITSHRVNVIMSTAHIGQLKLDGVFVPSSSFTPLSFCNTVSSANLVLTQGTHRLSADSGFTAYVYGTGGYESYAYSVGSFSKDQPIEVDSILCTTDTVRIGLPQPMLGPWWSTLTNPTDTIGIGSVLTLVPPIIPDIYILHGNEFVSGCETVFHFDVSIPTPPQIWASQTSSTACIGQLVQLNAGATPASSSFQYLWTPAAGLNNASIPNPVLTASVSGWYVVKVTSINGCTPAVYDSVFVDVFSAPLPVISAGPDQQICAGDSINIIATGGISYVWSSGATGASVYFSPSITTNFIVFATDTNGCGNNDTVKVKVNALPIANAGLDRSICENSTTTLFATGGINYSWDPGNLLGNNIVITPPSSTMYTVQITDINGCKNRDSVLVTVNPIAQANAGPDQDICIGDSTGLVASGGTSYFWTHNSSTSNSIIISPNTNTNYVVIVNNIYNCFSRDTVRVNVHTLPVANAGLNQSICFGDTTQLMASGGINFLWSPGGVSTNVMSVSPVISTSYSVLVTDAFGCKNTDTVNVQVNTLPVVNLGNDISHCLGDSVLLTSPIIAQSYLWMPSGNIGNSMMISPQNTSNYILIITDTNFCMNSDTIDVVVHPAVIADAGIDVLTTCVSLNTTLTATGGTSYLWNPGGFNSASIVVSPTATTTYSVIVMDQYNCTGIDSVQLIVSPLITGSGTQEVICFGDSLLLSKSGAISYLWMPGSIINDSILILPTQSSTYIAYMELSNGCLVYDTININVNPLPLADAGPDQEKCIGQNAILNASGGISYWWLNTGSTSATIMVTPPTSGYYVVKVEDVNGCSLLDSLYIQMHQLPNANAGNDKIICKGDSVLLEATGGVFYSWFPGGISGATNYFQPTSSIDYIVVVTDSNGCVNKDSVSVIPIEDPEVSFTVTAPICEKEVLFFLNNSSISIGTIVKSEWSFGDGGTSNLLNPIYNYALPGTYQMSLIVESDNGCIDSLFTTIFINEKPIIDFALNNECVNDEVQFSDHSSINAGAITKWHWEFGDGTTAQEQHPLHSYAEEGFYSVQLTATSDSGCVNSKIMNNAIQIYPLPIANFNASPFEASIYTPQIQFEDESIGSIQWSWNFADDIGVSNIPNPSYVYSDTGKFNVELIVASVHGCLDTIYKEVYISPGLSVYIPNSFTPNDDGMNDFFFPTGIGYSNLQLFIFNRWGDEIFSSNDPMKGWNGKTKNGNELCSDGVYIYVVRLTDYKNTPREYNGVVSLLR